MRITRVFPVLAAAAAALAAGCSNDTGATINTPPDLAYIRYVNGVGDTNNIDFRFVDQLEYSPYGVNVQFRDGTAYMGAATGTRTLRAFAHDTTLSGIQNSLVYERQLTLTAGQYLTLLYEGRARTNTDSIRVITDNVTAPAAGQISYRVYNLSGASVDYYVTASTSDALPASASGTVANNNASAYIPRAAGPLNVRVTANGSTTVMSSVQAPAGDAGGAGINPAAGATQAGTVFTVFVFPTSVLGSKAPQTAAFTGNPGITYFVDRRPGS